MRHLLALFLAATLVSGPLVFNPDRAEAMIAAPGLKGVSETITVVDTVTAPIRALMPSVTITTNTQVQTGGGKPNQTTTTTNTQVAPPK
jgi:hypothetical protein